MKTSIIKSTILLGFIIAAFTTNAQDYHLRHDTVYVYESWESIFDQTPDAMLLNPMIDYYTPFIIDFNVPNEQNNETLHNETVALTVGDSIWLVNTSWLQQNFKGDCKKMDFWAPLYFSAKIAFVEWKSYRASTGMTILGALLGDETLFYSDPEDTDGDYYMIDFENAEVYKIDHKRLSVLLKPYRDLKIRYEGMKDYKKRYMIKYFFLEYVNRLNDDPSVPYLLD